ncbi:Putative uncharacterized protein FLJ37770 [Eumeta japonica]|uniref:Mos1 transposase HTH domain-containing protein n=1 Tax=Eumeta variegata TaxID=151549 RepID=A0A4C1Z030_EUMVA|nr:Putative uncharacterized protein FLJ37770 [Eumeta japonica]
MGRVGGYFRVADCSRCGLEAKVDIGVLRPRDDNSTLNVVESVPYNNLDIRCGTKESAPKERRAEGGILLANMQRYAFLELNSIRATRALHVIPELGEITRCHDMEIHFKYSYKCTKCGYSNIEHRAVIKYFVKKGKTPKEIFEDMVSVLQESAPSYTMVKKWARLFQQGRESCEDDPRPGRPVTVVTEENVRKIEILVLADRRIKLWQIAEELQISKERVGEIIHEHMNMRKSVRVGTKMLTPFDKQRRLQTSKDFLELVGDNIDEICDRIVIVDETWVRQYDPESKQESMQWTKKGERPSKKFKAREQSYRSDVGSYRAECCFTRQCICPHGAGFEAGPEGHGLRKLTTHPTAQI